mmetsp:Transcript_38424/g.113986  ORF Transcript_38424/g.113986 Transcript_38424/m.113986 type:complete len:344 (-) Transcript_38424:1596-2627(-)
MGPAFCLHPGMHLATCCSTITGISLRCSARLCAQTKYKSSCTACMRKKPAERAPCYSCVCMGVPPSMCMTCLASDSPSGCMACAAMVGDNSTLHESCASCAAMSAGTSDSCYDCVLQAPADRVSGCSMCNGLSDPENVAGCHVCVGRGYDDMGRCEQRHAPPPPPPPPPPPGLPCFTNEAECEAAGHPLCGICSQLNDTMVAASCYRCICKDELDAKLCIGCLENKATAGACFDCLTSPRLLEADYEHQELCLSCAENVATAADCFDCVRWAPATRRMECPECRHIEFYPTAFCYSCVEQGYGEAGWWRNRCHMSRGVESGVWAAYWDWTKDLAQPKWAGNKA